MFLSMSRVIPCLCVLQVYDTITDAMYESLSRVEQASGIPQTRQLSKWQHLLAGDSILSAACLIWAISSRSGLKPSCRACLSSGLPWIQALNLETLPVRM